MKANYKDIIKSLKHMEETIAQIKQYIHRDEDSNYIVKLLNSVYADEWLAVYQYHISAVLTTISKNPNKEEIVKTFLDVKKDEEEHIKLLENEILRFGGVPIFNLFELTKYANDIITLDENYNCKSLIEKAIEAEQGAINVYDELSATKLVIDDQLINVLSAIKNDENEHYNLFSNILNKLPKIEEEKLDDLL